MTKGIRVNMRFKRVMMPALWIFLIAFGGCAIGPDFKDPESPYGEKWGDAPKTSQLVASETAETEQWWQSFKDPVLDDLIGRADQENLTLKMAGFRVLEARALRGVAVGNLFPQSQFLEGGVSRVNLSTEAANVFPVENFNDYGVGFDALWELDVWGRFRRGVEAADATLYATVMTFHDVWVSMTAEIALAYFDLCAYDQRIELLKHNIEIQKQTLRLVNARYRHGATTELDVKQSEAELSNIESFLPLLETGRQTSKNRLCVLLGLGPGKLNEMLAQRGTIPVPPENVTVGIPADLLTRRADIRQAAFSAKAQCARIGVEKSEFLPHIFLYGSVGFEAANAGDLFTSGGFTGMIGPSFRWNILNYGRIQNRVKAQDARFQQALTNYRLTAIRALNEVNNAMTAYVNTQDQVTWLSASVSATRKSLKLATLQYEHGLIDFQRVLDSQSFLVRQQDNLASARRNVAQNLVRLYKALGGGWEVRRKPQGRDLTPSLILKRFPHVAY